MGEKPHSTATAERWIEFSTKDLKLRFWVWLRNLLAVGPQVDHFPSLDLCPCLEKMELDLSVPLSAGQLTGFVILCTCQSALTLLPPIPPIRSAQGLSKLFRMNEFGRRGLADGG